MAEFKKIQKIDELFDIMNKGAHGEGSLVKNQETKTNPNSDEYAKFAGMGEVGGMAALGNDQARFMDFINGNGAYGQAGRDCSYALTMVALANPGAGAIVLGTLGGAAIIHAIATSAVVRFRQSKKYLDNLAKACMSEKGYIPGTRLFGSVRLNRFSKDYAIGGAPFQRDVQREMAQMNDHLYNVTNGFLDSAGGANGGPKLRFTEDQYQDRGLRLRLAEMVRTSAGTLYKPAGESEEIEKNLQDIFKRVASSDGNGKFNVDIDKLEKLAEKIEGQRNKGAELPLFLRMDEELKMIKKMGDDECENYAKKQSYSMKHAKSNSLHYLNDLKAIWGKAYEQIENDFNNRIIKVAESDDYKKLAAGIDIVANIRNVSQAAVSSRLECELGDLWVGQPEGAHGQGPLTWVVTENMSLRSGGDDVELTLANSDSLGNGNPIKRTVKFTDLYFGKTDVKMRLFRSAENKASLDPSGNGNYYLIDGDNGNPIFGGTSAMNVGGVGPTNRLYVQAFKGNSNALQPFGNLVNAAGFGKAPDNIVWYSVVNYSHVPVAPTVFWDTEEHFRSSILRSGFRQVDAASVKDSSLRQNSSAEEPFENALFEDGADTSSRPSGGSDSLNVSSGDLNVKIPSAYYYLVKKKKIVMAMSDKNGKVAYQIEANCDGDSDASISVSSVSDSSRSSFTTVSMSDWNSYEPVQIALLGSERHVTPAPHYGPEPPTPPTPPTPPVPPTPPYHPGKWPMTYTDEATFYMSLPSDMMHGALSAISFDEMVRDYGLSKYKLVYGDDGRVSGITDDAEYPGTSLADYETFKKYILFLGANTLFKDEPDYTETLGDNAEKYIHNPQENNENQNHENSQNDNEQNQGQHESVKYRLLDNVLNEKNDAAANATARGAKASVNNGIKQSQTVKMGTETKDDHSVKTDNSTNQVSGDGNNVTYNINYYTANPQAVAEEYNVTDIPEVKKPNLYPGVPAGVREICAVLKCFADKGAKIVKKTVDKGIIDSISKDKAYGIPHDDLKKIIAFVKNDTISSKVQPDLDPNLKFKIRGVTNPDDYTIFEVIDLVKNGANKTFTIRYAVPLDNGNVQVEDRKIEGPKWLEQISDIYPAVPYNEEVREEEAADSGIMAGYTYEISEDDLTSIRNNETAAESLFNKYYNDLYMQYRGYPVNEADDNQQDGKKKVLLKCEDILLDKKPMVAVFVMLDGSNTKVEIPLDRIIKKTEENHGTNLFVPYEVKLEEGKDYKFTGKSGAKFSDIFGINGDDSAHVVVKENLPNESTVKFDVYQNNRQGEGQEVTVEYYKLKNDDFEEITEPEAPTKRDSSLEIDKDYMVKKSDFIGILEDPNTANSVEEIKNAKDNDQFKFRVTGMSEDGTKTNIMVYTADGKLTDPNHHFIKEIDTEKLESIAAPAQNEQEQKEEKELIVNKIYRIAKDKLRDIVKKEDKDTTPVETDQKEFANGDVAYQVEDIKKDENGKKVATVAMADPKTGKKEQEQDKKIKDLPVDELVSYSEMFNLSFDKISMKVNTDYEAEKQRLLDLIGKNNQALNQMDPNKEVKFRDVAQSEDGTTTSIVLYTGDKLVDDKEHRIDNVDSKKLEEISKPAEEAESRNIQPFSRTHNTDGFYFVDSEIKNTAYAADMIERNADKLANFYAMNDASVNIGESNDFDSRFTPSARAERISIYFGSEEGKITKNVILNNIVPFAKSIANTSSKLELGKKYIVYYKTFDDSKGIDDKHGKGTYTQVKILSTPDNSVSSIQTGNGSASLISKSANRIYVVNDLNIREEDHQFSIPEKEINHYVFIGPYDDTENSSVIIDLDPDIITLYESKYVHFSRTMLKMSKLYGCDISEAIVLDYSTYRMKQIRAMFDELVMIVQNDMRFVLKQESGTSVATRGNNQHANQNQQAAQQPNIRQQQNALQSAMGGDQNSNDQQQG